MMHGWEKELPPIARERLAKIGDMTQAEKEKSKAVEQLDSLLSEFYKGDLNSEGLWKKLKVYKEEGKIFILKEAQIKLIDSLNLGVITIELQKRKAAIVGIETLKAYPRTSILEQNLNSIDALQTKYKKELQQRYDRLKAEIQSDPQLRMKQVKQGQTTVLMELTVDEAIRINPEWSNFMTTHERRYNEEFAKIIQRIKEQIR